MKEQSTAPAVEFDTPQLPARPVDYVTLTEFLRVVVDCVKRQPTRMEVLLVWLQTYDARPIKGGGGIVEGISKETGLHHVTVLRHVQAISSHRILSRVFRYKPSKIRRLS